MGLITKMMTKHYHEVPLLWINFDLEKYDKDGAAVSCMSHIHPVLAGDETITKSVNTLIDYIRNNYDMEKLSK